MGRKRLFITCVLCLVLVWALSFLFLLSFPIVFSFKTNTKVPLEFQVFYTTVSGEAFSESNSVKQKVKAGANQTVVFKLPVWKVKRLRIDFGNAPGEVLIRRLRLEGWRTLKIREFNGFYNQISSYTANKGILTIYSAQKDPYLAFKKKFNLYGGCAIDWKMLVIVATLAFLFAYKIVEYLSQFKITEKYSRIDIVFLSFFFVLLFVPMSRFSQAKITTQENRLLAVYKPLWNGQKVNFNFGKDFEQWFNDRFNGREYVTRLFNDIIFSLNRYYRNSKVFLGKDGWMFGLTNFHKRVYSDRDKQANSEGIAKLKFFCEKYKIKCYVEVVPRRVEFAKDKGLALVKDDNVDSVIVLREYLKAHNDFNIIYPIEELKEADKEDYVFFKTDHHWTEWGAYIGFKALMNEVKKDFSDIREVKESDYTVFYDKRVRAEHDRVFWNGYTFRMMNISDKFYQGDVSYKYYKHKDNGRLSRITDKTTKDLRSSYSKGAPYKAVIIGNSFTENFLSFLTFQFKEVRKFRSNSPTENSLRLSRWEKQIVSFQPDVLFIVIQSEYSGYLKTLKD